MTEKSELTEELVLTQEKEQEIIKEAEALKKELKLSKIIPIVVEGDDFDEKDLYVAFMKEPSFMEFSKFQTLSKSDEMRAMRALANDCFVGGDKELIENDSLFIGGAMQQLMTIVRFRKTKVINLSKAGK